MSETKSIIRYLLERNCVESLRSMNSLDLYKWLKSEFNLSSSLASYIRNQLKTYPADSLFYIYFPELRLHI